MGVDAREIQVGDVVGVRDETPAHHHRTPWFVKGKTGRIASISGPFLNPESRAHGGDGLPKRHLCSVEFKQVDIWGGRYCENDGDRLLVDIYEHWLEPG
ncbi:MAG: nitrile hydratase subunit beta [Gammaproteobacteria bacterium]|nr:nitrile hydratase subunit beta [Gammaproteobacteria bacterium]MDE0039160.1 nitrile hydratase subunit beta [Gammaproteobacteria bacterium]MDE0441474.1 nitrile hydratase subunit beta [Gammaproteobacteria bacterium]